MLPISFKHRSGMTGYCYLACIVEIYNLHNMHTISNSYIALVFHLAGISEAKLMTMIETLHFTK